jgi:hypothetical protein
MMTTAFFSFWFWFFPNPKPICPMNRDYTTNSIVCVPTTNPIK